MEELIRTQREAIEANKKVIESGEKMQAATEVFSDATLAREIAEAALRLTQISYVPPMVIVSAIISVMPASGRDARRLKLVKQDAERIVRERKSTSPETAS